MTEAEWLEAQDSWFMLQFLDSRNPSRRKLRLYLCACWRQFHWEAMRSNHVQEAVLTSERFADGLATEGELCLARQRLSLMSRERLEIGSGSYGQEDRALWAARVTIGLAQFSKGDYQTVAAGLWSAKYIRGSRLYRHLPQDLKSQVNVQCDLLRDVFAPFSSAYVDPSWLTWNSGTIPNLAGAIYQERHFSDCPVLADALEDAGCDNSDILEHCRAPGPHVRGCWVLDLLLDKE